MARKTNTNTPSAVAVIYARYSSHAQKDVSIEQQVEECEEYAAANNLEVVHVYADRAISGKTDRRPEFQKMIRHAERGQFQVLISYKSNRIARNMLQALAYEDKLSKWGIRVIYVKEEFSTMPRIVRLHTVNYLSGIKKVMTIGLLSMSRRPKLSERYLVEWRAAIPL